MRISDDVTFAGGNFDRAEPIRRDPVKLEAAENHPEAKFLAIWRGKPLAEAEARDQLVLLPKEHDIFIQKSDQIFLGLRNDVPYFAINISNWEPDNQEGIDESVFFDPSEQAHPAVPQNQRFVELRGLMAEISPVDAELAATSLALFAWHRTHQFCSTCGKKSDMAMAGWQRSCPACNGFHFPRTDPVVIMLITQGNNILLGRSHGWPEGMYSMLAGFVEPGESIETAVRREVFEETNIRVGVVDYLASQPWPFPNSLMFACAGIAQTKEITIDENELDDAIWISREELADVFAGQHPRINKPRKGAIAHFILRNWLADRLG
ncbi:hydrolase, NUDIX family protein [Rhodobacterales bacterium HTCC2150]|nr:hydrolase, NUDIX family protein [Rhodobacterales bacterium HTCC2150] [Rhodobacteraceae bacterium HTCC2150]